MRRYESQCVRVGVDPLSGGLADPQVEIAVFREGAVPVGGPVCPVSRSADEPPGAT